MKFIAALNAVNAQVWAFLILITGCGAVLTFHKAGIDIGIAAGIIGAGVNMFTSIPKATPGTTNTETNATTVNPPPSAAPTPTK